MIMGTGRRKGGVESEAGTQRQDYTHRLHPVIQTNVNKNACVGFDRKPQKECALTQVLSKHFTNIECPRIIIFTQTQPFNMPTVVRKTFKEQKP